MRKSMIFSGNCPTLTREMYKHFKAPRNAYIFLRKLRELKKFLRVLPRRKWNQPNRKRN